MQKFRVDISSRGAPMVLYAAQGDTKSRFFSVAMFDSGVEYSLPSGAYVTVRFGAPGMPAGWYDIIQEPGGGSHPAVSVDGNVITAELAEQAVSVHGKNRVWLLVNAADGYQLASWGFDLVVEAVQGLDAPEAQEYYNVLTDQVAKTLANAQAAASSAAQAQQYAESINTAQFATAAQGAKADTAVQSVNGQSGTTVTLTPATIGAADASDVLTLEEIQASTDLSGKIASASSVKSVDNRLSYLYSYRINSREKTNIKLSGFGSTNINVFYFGSFNNLTGYITGHFSIYGSSSNNENDVYKFVNGTMSKITATISSGNNSITIPLSITWCVGTLMTSTSVTIEYV